MKTLKGFVTIQSLISNVPNVVSPLGEISTWSLTFTKERGEYENTNLTGFRLVSIKSIDSVTGPVAVNTALADQVLTVVKAAYDFVSQHTYPYVAEDFIAALTSAVGGAITDVVYGDWVQLNAIALPTWISWNSTNPQDSTVKIWLSDPAFRIEFDEYEILVVPPITPIDQFFLEPIAVRNLVNAVTVDSQIDRVNTIKNQNPETAVRAVSFWYNDPLLHTNVVLTTWYVVIYGAAGDSPDNIKSALITWILDQSSHTQGDWIGILPDLIQRLEFIILPRWDLYAIPDLPIQSGIYSSTIDPTESITHATGAIDFYPQDYIPSHTLSVPFPYNGLSLLIVKGYNNNSTTQSFRALFGDYIPVSTLSLDFNRMTDITKSWVTLMMAAIIKAESIQNVGDSATPFRTMLRSGKLYIVATYDDIDYLVAAKVNP